MGKPERWMVVKYVKVKDSKEYERMIQEGVNNKDALLGRSSLKRSNSQKVCVVTWKNCCFSPYPQTERGWIIRAKWLGALALSSQIDLGSSCGSVLYMLYGFGQVTSPFWTSVLSSVKWKWRYLLIVLVEDWMKIMHVKQLAKCPWHSTYSVTCISLGKWNS